MDSLRLRFFVLWPQVSQSHRCFTFQHYSDPWKSIQASTKSQKSHPQRITEYTRMVLKRLEIFIIEINEKSKLGNISYSYNHGNVNRHRHIRMVGILSQLSTHSDYFLLSDNLAITLIRPAFSSLRRMLSSFSFAIV